jgi:competence protein ComEA
MSAVPTKRLFVYVALGMVVLAVGVLAVLTMGRGGSGSGEPLTVVDQGSGTSLDAIVGVSSSTTTTTVPVRTIFVQVAGAVRRPGVYEMTEGARVFQAIEEAGGFIEAADQQAVTLAAQVTDGCRVYVPREGETTTTAVATVTGGTSANGPGGSGPVSLNSATLEQLDALPGIGPSTAQKIITYRETKGPFTSVDQLTEVPGIGPSKLEELRPLVGL